MSRLRLGWKDEVAGNGMDGMEGITGDFSRYARQMAFLPLGPEGQERLAEARMGVLGCGGLGSAASSLLARAGVGFLRLADDDTVDITNLQRQSLYTEADVDRRVRKVIVAAERLRAMNAQVEVEGSVCRVGSYESMAAFIDGLDVVVDATDNFGTRFLLNRVAVERGTPWVYGGVSGSSGMTMTVVPGLSPCLRCMFHDPGVIEPPGSRSPATAVLGPIVAVIGAIQANEAIKVVADRGAVNPGLLAVDLWTLSFECVEVVRNDRCPDCGSAG